MKLEASISSIEEVLNRDSDPSLGQVLKKKKLELSSFRNERVKGALIRCRFLQLKDMDAPSSFFFNLERSVAQRKQMTCLQLPGGRVTTSPGEMRSHAMVFYADLFGAQQCSMQSREELLEGLPQLSLDEKAALDCELTLEELKAAVNQMATGKAPGIDGLSTDFYKHFWNTIGPDLHECLVKTGAGLSRPVPVQRGIRQGCPISGQLYTLAIEPLLCRVRARLSGLLLPGSLSVERPIVVSAYADDVNIFVCSQKDVQCLQDALSLYERATSARVNWAKSEALLVGQWRGKAVPSLPGGLEWGKEGLKVLGVFWGSEGFVKKNWEGVKEKVCARLSRWTWLLPQLSNRGRVLVANNLVASTLWHKLIAIVPPRGLMEDVQRTIVDFFWSGRHWVRASVLYLPVAEGGQGLVDIQSRIASFRLQTAQKLLYKCGPSWLDTARLLLRRAGRLGYDKQLFLLRTEDVDLNGLTSFYNSVLQAWQVLQYSRDVKETPGMWLFEEPLFFNNFLGTRTLQSASLRASLREAGCTKLGHLMKMTAISVDVLRVRSNITSSRLIDRVVKEVCAALGPPQRTLVENRSLCEQWSDGWEYSFPSLTITPSVGEWQEEAGQLLSFSTPQLGKFQDAGKKELYYTCIKVLNIRFLAELKESRWTEFFGPDASRKGSWRSLYKLPVEKRAADLQWRIVHGAIATNRYRAHIDPELGEGSPPTVRIVHSGQACNVEEERYSERVYTIREGETLELQCLVTGHPRPQSSASSAFFFHPLFFFSTFSSLLRLQFFVSLES
ncbi:hypothetical protein PFLUV_G00237720 [Perca fluviatilis]|uniref:Reverse transcriptase domain-containing protein n=1 Tax=Perca fluviatilis TaxID=8168 RepID=A0A6A5EAF4_PERFL|nr:hypothetical protein PFLUV_G00237720 [Perca fluviatilis]